MELDQGLLELYHKVARCVIEGLSENDALDKVGITDKELRRVFSRYLSGIPLSNVVVLPSESTGWYEQEPDSEYWPSYFSLLTDEHRKNMPHAAISIDETSTRVINQLNNPKLGAVQEAKYGLVIGHVQSGKTAQYAGVIAKAADSGYRLILVLSGVYNDLRLQTQTRLSTEITGSERDAKNGNDLQGHIFRKRWNELTSPNADFHENVQHLNHLDLLKDNPSIAVTKKNKSPLQKLKFFLMQLTYEQRSNIPLLVIDDECDFASINTSDSNAVNESERDPRAINLLLREILELFPNRAYIGYTASPFANVFIHPDGDQTGLPTLYPRDFLVCLPRPRGYSGFDTIFPENPEESPWRLVEEGDPQQMAEADHIRLLADDVTAPPSSDFTLFPSLKLALFDFILSWAVRMSRGESDFHHSMLVHVKHTTQQMGPLRDLISNAVNSAWRGAFTRTRLDRLSNTQRQLLDDLKDHYKNSFATSIFNPPIFEEVHSLVRKLMIDGISVLEINHTSTDELDYRVYQQGRAVIAIGGNRLSRGLTLEGLTVSYFVRRSERPSADTLLQMGRWFGYRPGYKDLVRLYSTTELIEDFEKVMLIEESLRNDAERLEAMGATPDDFALRVLRTQRVMPTSDVKMRNVALTNLTFDATILPKQGMFFFDDHEAMQQNLDSVERFVESLPKSEDQYSTIAGSHLWRGVQSEQILSLLESQILPGDPYEIGYLADFITRTSILDNVAFSSWSVGLISLSQGRGGITTQVGGLDLILPSRAKLVGRNSLGNFAAPDDYAIDLPPPLNAYRVDGRLNYSRMFSVRDYSNPLCLIYVFDRNSSPKTQTRERMYKPESVGPHVAAISIAIPGMPRQLVDEQSERIMWANAFRETID